MLTSPITQNEIIGLYKEIIQMTIVSKINVSELGVELEKNDWPKI